MRHRMQTTFGNKSVLGSNAQAITQLYKKEKYMNHLLPSYNLEWLENKMTFGWTNKPSAPAPVEKPKKSVAEVNADANRDRNLRAEQANERKTQTAGKRRRRGRSLLISKGNTEEGLSDTLG